MGNVNEEKQAAKRSSITAESGFMEMLLCDEHAEIICIKFFASAVSLFALDHFISTI